MNKMLKKVTKEWSNRNYTVFEIIGKGGYAIAYKAQDL